MTRTAGEPAGAVHAELWELDALLRNRRWVRRRLPFPHVVARDVFVPAFYERLASQFREVERERPQAFRRDMPGYDATGAALGTFADGPLGVFVSRPWHDLMAGLFGVSATGDVNASLHHHEPGSADGWPHNDLNPGWFGGAPAGAGEVRLNTDYRVSYYTGEGPDATPARETVRAVSLLFYLANPDWHPGDGGETALYARRSGGAPAVLVPPVNNSLVAFECTPHSFHGFVGNRRTVRNSVVMWVHRPPADVQDRWGAESIVRW